MIPQDPVMLLSFINLKLRDFYGSLKQLCDDLDVKEQEITRSDPGDAGGDGKAGTSSVNITKSGR